MRFNFVVFIYFCLLKIFYREAKKFKCRGTILFPDGSAMFVGFFQGFKPEA